MFLENETRSDERDARPRITAPSLLSRSLVSLVSHPLHSRTVTLTEWGRVRDTERASTGVTLTVFPVFVTGVPRERASTPELRRVEWCSLYVDSLPVGLQPTSSRSCVLSLYHDGLHAPVRLPVRPVAHINLNVKSPDRRCAASLATRVRHGVRATAYVWHGHAFTLFTRRTHLRAPSGAYDQGHSASLGTRRYSPRAADHTGQILPSAART